MMSAALPWMGVFAAMRSAPERTAWFFEVMSRTMRRRPLRVRTAPVLRASSIN